MSIVVVAAAAVSVVVATVALLHVSIAIVIIVVAVRIVADTAAPAYDVGGAVAGLMTIIRLICDVFV